MSLPILTAVTVASVAALVTVQQDFSKIEPVEECRVNNGPPLNAGFIEPGFDTLDPLAYGYIPREEEYLGQTPGSYGIPKCVSKNKGYWQFKYEYGNAGQSL